jgi:hypothetical protein
MVILSGPEPQRGLLESILKSNWNAIVVMVFIKGLVEDEQNS